jgi:hypothetical protein
MGRVTELDTAIRGFVFELLTGETSFDDFLRRFVMATTNESSELAAEIRHVLAERRLLADEELFESLRVAASTITDGPEPELVFANNAFTISAAPLEIGGTTTITRRLALSGT